MQLTKRATLSVALAFGLAANPAAYATETVYNVSQSYNQVVYNNSHPTWDTLFTGSFTFDSAAKTVSNLTGSLSQAMDGNTTWVPLTYQLSSIYDANLGGLLVSVFHQNTTNTFAGYNLPAANGMLVGGTFVAEPGWKTGGNITYGNQNAYATIFVNTTDPLAALTADQTAKLAYADCTSAGLMPRNGSGTICMTGWVDKTKANLAGGTMQGTYPITQSITAAVPEPETYAMFLAGIGMLGAIARRRKAG